MHALQALLRVLAFFAGCFLGCAVIPALADDLCGRPMEAPDALFERLAKTEKLPEIHRDKGYVALHDKARSTTWTFTIAGHPAHPSAVCRRPIEGGDGLLRIEMNVTCSAVEAECERLVNAFEELNKRVVKDIEKQQKK